MNYEELMNKAYSNLISEYADTIASRIVNRIIRLLQSVKRDSDMMLSGDDSGLENFWDEICVQTQYQYFIFWNAYEDFVLSCIVDDVEKKCKDIEKKFLWLQTDSFSEWCDEIEDYDEVSDNAFDESGFPSYYNSDAVVDYIYSLVMRRSMDYSNSRIQDYIQQSLGDDF